MNPVKRFIEKITQGVLFTSSMVTTVTVLLVVLFLFREGIGLFNQTSVENHYTIIIVTHNLQQAGRISDYTAFFYLGELVEWNKTKTIFTNPTDIRTQNYITGRFG
jgi:ABC-type microcin C transport system duplicated ATPase subunit YejF